jgi:hypothetical protein
MAAWVFLLPHVNGRDKILDTKDDNLKKTPREENNLMDLPSLKNEGGLVWEYELLPQES